MRAKTEKRTLSIVLTLLLAGMFAPAAWAEIPLVINHQGVIEVGTTPFNGTGYFRFAVYSPSTTQNLWTNDASNTGSDAMPDTAVPVPVSNGIYSLGIGDTALTNMVALGSDVFSSGHEGLVIRIWFDDQSVVDEAQLLEPAQPITSAAYAYQAGNADMLGGKPANHYSTYDDGYFNYLFVEDGSLDVSAGSGDAITIWASGEDDSAINAESSGPDSVCVNAEATGSNGTALRGEATDDDGIGVSGYVTGASSMAVKAQATGADGRGVYAEGATAIEAVSTASDGFAAELENDDSGNYCQLAGPDTAGYFGGDVTTTGEYKYETPRQHYLSIPPSAFIPMLNVDYSHGQFPNLRVRMNVYAGRLTAPVYLPDGATITEFRVDFLKEPATSTADIEVRFERLERDGSYGAAMAELDSTGIDGRAPKTTSEISSASINNANYSYYVQVHGTAWDDFDGGVTGALITYTVSEAP